LKTLFDQDEQSHPDFMKPTAARISRRNSPAVSEAAAAFLVAPGRSNTAFAAPTVSEAGQIQLAGEADVAEYTWKHRLKTAREGLWL